VCRAALKFEQEPVVFIGRPNTERERVADHSAAGGLMVFIDVLFSRRRTALKTDQLIKSNRSDELYVPACRANGTGSKPGSCGLV